MQQPSKRAPIINARTQPSESARYKVYKNCYCKNFHKEKENSKIML